MCRTGRYRRLACCGWLLFCFWVGWFWFGGLGVGLVCVGATRWLRDVRRRVAFVVKLADAQLVQVWGLPLVVRIQTVDRHYWVWRDELSAEAWAGLRRHLRTRLPGQALGLSISR